MTGSSSSSSSGDGRSVGELLLDTEFIARDILLDGPNLDAAAMLRTWGEVVQAAGDLWAALPLPIIPTPRPGPSSRTQRSPEEVVMDRLQTMTTALHRSIRGTSWPGAGPGDPRLTVMADNLTRAADLVTAAEPNRPQQDAARADLDAAKARLMHALYIGAHGVAVAVGYHARDLQDHFTRKGWIAPNQSLTAARSAQNRLAVFEHLTGSYVARTYPGALSGEHRPPPGPERSAQVLASWDVQAHRVLASDPSAANLMLTAQTQTVITASSHLLLDAAAQTGQIPVQGYRTRLSPALDTAHSGWASTARTWGALTPPSQRRPANELSLAAAETRAALREITHDRTGPAPVEVIEARVDLAHAAATIQQALSTSVELAHLMRDIIQAPHLSGAARAVNAISKTSNPTVLSSETDPGHEAAFVDPRGLAANRPVVLPDLALDTCRTNLDHTITTARDAMSAAAILDSPPTNPHQNQPPNSPGRHFEERDLDCHGDFGQWALLR